MSIHTVIADRISKALAQLPDVPGGPARALLIHGSLYTPLLEERVMEEIHSEGGPLLHTRTVVAGVTGPPVKLVLPPAVQPNFVEASVWERAKVLPLDPLGRRDPRVLQVQKTNRTAKEYHKTHTWSSVLEFGDGEAFLSNRSYRNCTFQPATEGAYAHLRARPLWSMSVLTFTDCIFLGCDFQMDGHTKYVFKDCSFVGCFRPSLPLNAEWEESDCTYYQTCLL